MKEYPTYDELIAANDRLQQKVDWLEGVFQTNREAGVQVRSRFLSNISHEIRTPMNAILGFSNLLGNTDLTDKEREEYVQYISHNSHALLKVMDNIIDLTLLETKNLALKKEDVHIENLLSDLFNHYNSRVIREMNQRVALLLTVPPYNGKVVVQADGFRLQRILDNLVNNAISNQGKGVIEMKMEILSGKKVRISVVSDTNELLVERAKMIFDINGNTDDWHNHLDTTGLAYKLAKDLSKAMGGRVSLAESKKRFSVQLDFPAIGTGKVNGLHKSEEALLNLTGLIDQKPTQ